MGLAIQRRADPVHVDRAGGGRTFGCMADGLQIPAIIAAGAVEQAAAAYPVLPNERRQAAQRSHRLAAVTVTLDTIRELEQRRPGGRIATRQVDDRPF